MISPWKRANIQRSFDSDPNCTRCAKECHVDPKTGHKDSTIRAWHLPKGSTLALRRGAEQLF